MSKQLIYTSAPRGLKPSSSGFCTVAADGGMSPPLMMKLELLSGYEFRYNLSDPNAERNPINFSHTRVAIGGQACRVLSRVAFCGADYSGRSNKIAHHFLLEPDELIPAGPGWMVRELACQGRFRTDWNDPPKILPPVALADVLHDDASPERRPLEEWSRLGDPGWAGVMAKAFCRNKKVPTYVIFEPGADLLGLFEESLRLLPPNMRWDVCFATYYTSAPPDCHYHWRGVLAGSSIAREMARFPQAVVLDLTKPLPAVPAGDEDEFAAAARAGSVVPSLQPISRPMPTARPARIAGVAGAAMGHQEEDKARARAWDSATAGAASPARTAPRPPTPPPHFVTVEKAPGWMIWTMFSLAALVAMLAASNAATLWMLHRDRAGRADTPAEGVTVQADGPACVPTTGPATQQEGPAAPARNPPRGPATKPASAAATSQPEEPPANHLPAAPSMLSFVRISRLIPREPDNLGSPEMAWGEQDQLDNPITMSCKLPTTANESWHIFDLPACLKSKSIKVDIEDEQAILWDGREPSAHKIMTASLARGDDGKSVALQCDVDGVEGSTKENNLWLARFFVIEVQAKKAEKTIGFALRPRDPKPIEVEFGWIGGKSFAPLNQKVDIDYPWPDLLHGHPGPDAKPAKFDPIKLKVDGKDANLSLTVQENGPKAHVAVSCPELDKLLTSFGKAITDAQRKRDAADKDIEASKKKSPPDEKALKAAQGEQKKANEAERGVMRKLDKHAEHLAKHCKFVLYDPWDLPVAEVTFKLVLPPESKESGGGK